MPYLHQGVQCAKGKSLAPMIRCLEMRERQFLIRGPIVEEPMTIV